MQTEDGDLAPSHTVEGALRAILPLLPKPVRLRAENSLVQFDRALKLFPLDREIASFRAITGEEEAAAALFKALQRQGYPRADKLSVHDHTHKAAAVACLKAIRLDIGQAINNIKVEFDLKAPRIDVKIPLSELGVKQPAGMDLCVQPVEPLDILRSTKDGRQDYAFEHELASLAKGAKFEEIRAMVKASANARNRLLYASNKSLPKSRTTEQIILSRKEQAIALLCVSVIALQTPRHQAMLCQAINAMIEITKRLPPDPDPDAGRSTARRL